MQEDIISIEIKIDKSLILNKCNKHIEYQINGELNKVINKLARDYVQEKMENTLAGILVNTNMRALFEEGMDRFFDRYSVREMVQDVLINSKKTKLGEKHETRPKKNQ